MLKFDLKKEDLQYVSFKQDMIHVSLLKIVKEGKLPAICRILLSVLSLSSGFNCKEESRIKLS